MPHKLLKHGKEHIGVINLDLKLDSIKHSVGLQMGTMVWKKQSMQRFTAHLDWLGYEVWKFEVISINSASSTHLFLASYAIHHILSCPQ